MRHPLKVGLLAFLLTTPTLSAVSDNVQSPQGGATFRSRTDLVVVHVTVVDRRGNFVAGLGREDFIVYEDGRPQPISFFLHEDTPVTVGLVIDNSASMRTRRDEVIAAGLAFARASHPDDEIFTVHFNERVWPGLEPPRQFTSSLASLEAALERTIARGQTAIFDAVLFGLHHLERGTAPKKALVVLSDGDDNASRANVTQVLEAAHRTDAVIYTIGLFGDDGRGGNPRLLRSLATATGGASLVPERANEIVSTLERVARDIRSSYTIGYSPPGGSADTGFHAIRVSARGPHGDRVSVRARSGYLSGPGDVSHGR